MIDRLSRDAAAKLVRQFRDGQIDSLDLESDWPSSDDKSLDAMASMFWASYGDNDPRRLIGRHVATPEVREALTRYAAFLDTALSYEWPQANFGRVAGVGVVLLILSLGLLWPIDLWIKQRNARFEARLEVSGDFDVWPFIRRGDSRDLAQSG